MLRFAASSLMSRVSQIAASNPLKLTNALQGAITDTMGTSGVPSTSTSWLGALCRGLKKSAQQVGLCAAARLLGIAGGVRVRVRGPHLHGVWVRLSVPPTPGWPLTYGAHDPMP